MLVRSQKANNKKEVEGIKENPKTPNNMCVFLILKIKLTNSLTRYRLPDKRIKVIFKHQTMKASS
jgi:hypothetical protein